MDSKNWFKQSDVPYKGEPRFGLGTQEASIKCYAGITEDGPWVGIDRQESPWVFMSGFLEIATAQPQLLDYAELWFKTDKNGEPIQIASLIAAYQGEETHT